MDLFEYQAKELFAKHNVPTTPGRVTDSAEGAKAIAEEIGKPVSYPAIDPEAVSRVAARIAEML